MDITHRLTFPMTRELARRVLVASAVVTNRLTAEYLDEHLESPSRNQNPSWGCTYKWAGRPVKNRPPTPSMKGKHHATHRNSNRNDRALRRGVRPGRR
ncbi:hypothetical protein SEA_POUND_58 [Mycobacterium phage Pound]|nr:hypothetical protein SEA_POUND_58 [Mycobacterium phage Pound]